MCLRRASEKGKRRFVGVPSMRRRRSRVGHARLSRGRASRRTACRASHDGEQALRITLPGRTGCVGAPQVPKRLPARKFMGARRVSGVPGIRRAVSRPAGQMPAMRTTRIPSKQGRFRAFGTVFPPGAALYRGPPPRRSAVCHLNAPTRHISTPTPGKPEPNRRICAKREGGAGLIGSLRNAVPWPFSWRTSGPL